MKTARRVASTTTIQLEEQLPERLNLAVGKDTGTPGDDSVAWGLAILAHGITGCRVLLQDQGDRFTITSRERVPPDAHRDPGRLATLRLTWIASTEKKKWPPEGLRDVLRWEDRDTLRQLAANQAAARKETDAMRAGEGSSVAGTREASLYGHYVALMNPNPTWQGYNKVVELARFLLTPAGIAFLFQVYDAERPMPPDRWPRYLRDLGVP